MYFLNNRVLVTFLHMSDVAHLKTGAPAVQ